MIDAFDHMDHSSIDEDELNLGTRVIDVDTIECNSINRVPKDYDMRIDLIANDINSNTATIDFIMYVNHIINPFSIMEGDIIATPIYNESLYIDNDPIEYPEKSTDNDFKPSIEDEINQAANILKNHPDTNRKERLQKLANALVNGATNISGPNEI